MKLYTDTGNFQALKVAISSKVTGIDVQHIEVGHTDRISHIFSETRLPVLELSEGRFLFVANAAAKYLFLKAGRVSDEDNENEILDWENTSLMPYVASYLVSVIGHGKKDKGRSDQLVKLIKRLDHKLGKDKYLLGDEMGVGDVCVFSTLFPLTLLKNCDLISKFANVKRWAELMSNNSSIQQAVSEVIKGKGQDCLKASLLSQTFPAVPNTEACKASPSSSSAKAKDAVKPPSSKDQAAQEIVLGNAEEDEMDAARNAWTSDQAKCPRAKERFHPVLPKDDERNILVCSALPYVNNVPHLGNIIGCVLSADVYSRYCRLRNYNVLYICGTDEYGTTTETKALQEGVTPREICDKYNKLHTDIYNWFNIDFDHFGRTTHPKHTEIAQDMFHKIYNNGFILKDSLEQLHCDKCNKFLADRFVGGTCPFCAYDDARGDQCDGCGKLINANELIKPSCKMCKSEPVIKSTDHLFLDLPKIEPRLKSLIDSVSGNWTNNARVITNAWLRDGLKPRCISRDLKWGIPVPLQGYKDKVLYVWFDAPFGYMSSTACYTEHWQKWWKNPDKVELYHFLGKDNVPFHSVIFPSCLMGAQDGYTLVNNIISTEYLNYEDTKFSKSRGVGVFGDQAAATGIPADVFRFYLLYVRPESQDTAFSWDDFLLKNNSELLNNLGNFINRSLSFLASNFGGVIQPMEPLTQEDANLLALITREVKGYIANLEACRLRDGIRNILSISRLGNQYMQLNKPWVLAKGSTTDKQRAGHVVSINCNISCLLAVLLHPYMPETSNRIQAQLHAPKHINVIAEEFTPRLTAGHKIGTPSPLFQKIEATTIENLKANFAGSPPPAKPAAKAENKPSGDTNAATTASNPEEVNRLTQAVTDQGTVVRELKTAKAAKASIDAEVAKLLSLKRELALAQGLDPNAAPASGGKKKGKKK